MPCHPSDFVDLVSCKAKRCKYNGFAAICKQQRCNHVRAVGKGYPAKTQRNFWTIAASYATIMPNYAATTPTSLRHFWLTWPGMCKKTTWLSMYCISILDNKRATTLGWSCPKHYQLQWVKIAYYQWIGFVGKNWNRKAPWSSWENLWFPKFPVSIFPTKPIHCLLGLGWSEALKNTPSGSFFWATHMNHIIPIKSL